MTCHLDPTAVKSCVNHRHFMRLPRIGLAVCLSTGAFLRAQTPTPTPAIVQQQHVSVPCVSRPAGGRGSRLDCYQHTLSGGGELGYSHGNNAMPSPPGSVNRTDV